MNAVSPKVPWQFGGLDAEAILSRAGVTTPVYVYDLDAITRVGRAASEAFGRDGDLVAYAVKANSAGPIVRAFAREGLGADVVSGAELRLAMGAGIPPERIVFSGVAKRDEELDLAMSAGESGILAIQAESIEEILRIEARARAFGRKARVSIRVNPAIEKRVLGTHDHIATGHDEAKFGVPLADVPHAVDVAAGSDALAFVGLAVHVGSQLATPEPYLASARALFDLVKSLRASGKLGADFRFLDTGGGFGIAYDGRDATAPAAFVRALAELREASGLGDLRSVVEPGRSLVGPHGIVLTRVIQTKRAKNAERRWVMIDCGMNDLVRPALYQARHRIVPASGECGSTIDDPSPSADRAWRVVGPVCESTDDFGVHAFDEEPHGLLAILDAGAYGFSMASQYNGRAIPSEVFLSGGEVAHVLRGASADAWVDGRLGDT